MIVIFRYGQEAAFNNRLNAIGIPAHWNADRRHKQRKRRSVFLGHPATDINGDTFQRAIIDEKEAAKFSQNDHNPAFAIVWRDNVFDDNEELLPEPLAEVEYIDINEVVTIVQQQIGTF